MQLVASLAVRDALKLYAAACVGDMYSAISAELAAVRQHYEQLRQAPPRTLKARLLCMSSTVRLHLSAGTAMQAMAANSADAQTPLSWPGPQSDVILALSSLPPKQLLRICASSCVVLISRSG